MALHHSDVKLLSTPYSFEEALTKYAGTRIVVELAGQTDRERLLQKSTNLLPLNVNSTETISCKLHHKKATGKFITEVNWLVTISNISYLLRMVGLE